MTIDRTDINELRQSQIKDIFLIAGNGATYIRFLLVGNRHFDVGLDSIFDEEGNHFDTENLNYRP